MLVDVAILGAGFGGSLTALLLQRIGLSCVLIDRGSHPRFAIGESTTPTANLVLRDLAETYKLPRLAPLAKHGTWQEAYPDVVHGPKRGFSYFQHHPGQAFQAGPDHGHELLVASSSSLATADTHWRRSDVDHFLAREVQATGIPYFDKLAVNVSRQEHGFRLSGEREGEAIVLDAKFLIDATGEAGVVLKTFGIPQRTGTFFTNSRGLFGHFTGLTPWEDVMVAAGESVADHPFPCDQSALHQVIDEGWMWQLRFDNGVTSAGFALDGDRTPLDPAISPADEWSRLMDRYPSLGEQFAATELVAPAGGLCRTGRLQRRALHAAGENWAALPNTAGFIDPLFSTGIAHSLCGIERLTQILAAHWDRSSLPAALALYEHIVRNELDFADEIVGTCFASFRSFEAFHASCMLYFAAATTYERRRLAGSLRPGAAFLCADDVNLRGIVSRARERLMSLLEEPESHQMESYLDRLKDEIAPFNHVGLFMPEVRHIYRHTAVPE